jgi:RNA-directed DNA polymerase
MIPKPELKFVQKWVMINILAKYPLNDSCHSFRRGRSTLTNAMIHRNAQFMLKIDLLKFYDTITEARVAGIFSTMGYAKNLSISMANLLTAKHRREYWNSFSDNEKILLSTLIKSEPPVLPQGAPSSPMLSNIMATRLDKRLSALAETIGCNYTRYADDLTFSSDEFECLPHYEFLKKIVEEEGFYINEDKVLLCKRGVKQYVTGLTITNDVHVPKKYRKKILSHLYFAKKYGPIGHMKRWGSKSNIPKDPQAFQDWLLGSICYVRSVDEKAGEMMLKQFNKIDWTL